MHVCVVDVSILSGGKLPFFSLGMRRYGRRENVFICYPFACFFLLPRTGVPRREEWWGGGG